MQSIITERDVNSAFVKQLRKDLGINQADFWAPIGATQSGGSRWENGRNIPKPIRRLVFAIYVAKLDLDCSTNETAAHLMKVGELSRNKAELERLSDLQFRVTKAKEALSSAGSVLSEVL